MRDREELLARYEELRSRRLSQRKGRFLSHSYLNCGFNVRQRVKGNGKCGFCKNPHVLSRFGGGPLVCDEDGRSETCQHFECQNTPESVERDFEAIISSPARCGNEYPKLAVLIWCLQSAPKRLVWSRFWTAFLGTCRSMLALFSGRW